MIKAAILLTSTALLACTTLAAPVAAAPPTGMTDFVAEDYLGGAWVFYKRQFLQEGRVIDNVNGGVSHSEGQGYGMLLAVAAGDKRSFDQIWDWTFTNLIKPRNNGKLGLAAWKWDPNSEAKNHLDDLNNATDGDLLIAWALLRAYKRWGDTDNFDAARAIAAAIATDAVESDGTNTILLPGATGFGDADAPNGPVVNLSYWVFPALAELDVFKDVFPAKALIATGLSLIGQAQFGPARLPGDWIALGGDKPALAEGHAETFGYDAVRIPLYLAWYKPAGQRPLAAFLDLWPTVDAKVSVVDLASGKATSPMGSSYTPIADLVLCSAGKFPADPPPTNLDLTQYYPSTLDMLSLLAMVERYPQCLTAS